MNVELRDIHKTFGHGPSQVHANTGITLTIPAGCIQGILGENGAGKSTLMKILSGYIQNDRGEILLDERPVVIKSPADAIHHGIGMLHQDPLDFPPMQVIDNFMLGSGGSLLPNSARALAGLLELENQFGFSIDPRAYVDTLTVGERQQLEIMRLLWLGARVLILDEPTTGISALQKEKLFAALKILASQGKTIIFVSHKLEDVENLCTQAAVLRQGVLVGEARPPYEANRLVEMMFSRAVKLPERRHAEPGPVTLKLENISLEDYRLEICDVNVEAHAGEIIGLAGMEGSGQAMLLRACAGLVRPVNGKISVNNRDLTGKSYRSFMRHGVSFLPASRMEEGLIPGLTLTEHFILANKSTGTFIDWEGGIRTARERIADFNIRGTPATRVEALSGGNQQRALLALLHTPLALILLEHPTRGLDIESTIYIWGKLKERCQAGTTILFISADLDEILRYSNRILVFFSGQVSPPLDAATTDVDQLGQLIGGKGWKELFDS